MTIIHAFTSFNTTTAAPRIAPSSTVTPGPTKASAQMHGSVRIAPSSLSRSSVDAISKFERFQRRGDHRRRDRLNEVCVIHNLKWLIGFLDSAEFTLSDPADAGESKGLQSQSQTEATSSHRIDHLFALANATRAMAAAAVRFSTQSLRRMRSTCLQIVPVHALRIRPIS